MYIEITQNTQLYNMLTQCCSTEKVSDPSGSRSIILLKNSFV